MRREPVDGEAKPRRNARSVIGSLSTCRKRSSSRQIDGYLLSFCASCPDPVGAMDIVVEAPRGSTCEQVLELVLAMPERSVSSWSESELALDHPLRTRIFSST